MLSALLIGPEDALFRACKEKLASVEGIFIAHQAYHYPSPAEVSSLIEEFQPDLLIVNLADYTQVCRSIGRLAMDRPQLPVIAVSTGCEPGLLLDLMQLGVRELWFEPLNLEQMQAAVSRFYRLKSTAKSAARGAVLAFLPARSGCGTTTIALNAAAAIQKLRPAVLFADFDFHNSIVAFWLKLQPRHGFREALERAHWLDTTLWKSMVYPYRGLDLLISPQEAGPSVFSGSETAAVLDFACQHYQYVLVDLPEAIYTSCWEVLERARQVMLVVTPETSSLYLARRKIVQVVNHGIPRDRLCVLLNRTTHIDLQPGEVEKFLGVAVMASFPNQYRAVTAAFMEGKFMPEDSKLGAQFTEFAYAVTGETARPREPASAVHKLRRILSSA